MANVHDRVALSAISSYGQSLDADRALWDRLGVATVGLSWRKLEEAGVERAVAALAADGREVCSIGELGWAVPGDAATWPAHRARLSEAVAVAAALDARCLVVLTGPAVDLDWDDAAAALADLLAPVAREARTAGIALAVENTNPMLLDLGFATTLRDTVDLAAALEAAVCVEVASCFAERDLATTLRRAGSSLALVQVSDVVLASRCTPDRRVPGDGDVPLARVLDRVHAAGYRGPLELELVGPAIEAEGYEPALRRAVAALSGLLTDAGD